MQLLSRKLLALVSIDGLPPCQIKTFNSSANFPIKQNTRCLMACPLFRGLEVQGLEREK